MIISVIYNPLDNTFKFLEGIHRYQSYTSFFNVEDDFFSDKFIKQLKSIICYSIIKGKVLDVDKIKRIIPQTKDKQFKRQL